MVGFRSYSLKVTPLRLVSIGEVTLSKDEPLSVDLTMFPYFPTATKTLGAVVVVTAVTSAITGAFSSSSSLAQEKTVRLKRDMRIMYKTLFIFFLHQK